MITANEKLVTLPWGSKKDTGLIEQRLHCSSHRNIMNLKRLPRVRSANTLSHENPPCCAVLKKQEDVTIWENHPSVCYLCYVEHAWTSGAPPVYTQDTGGWRAGWLDNDLSGAHTRVLRVRHTLTSVWHHTWGTEYLEICLFVYSSSLIDTRWLIQYVSRSSIMGQTFPIVSLCFNCIPIFRGDNWATVFTCSWTDKYDRANWFV